MMNQDIKGELTNIFTGSWDVQEATLPNAQSGYTGTITIRPNHHVFDLIWAITAGQYVGIGLSTGPHLLVSCGEQRAGLGIALYKTRYGSSVSVSWSSPELQGELGSGEFTSPFHGSFESEHQLIQFLPDGSLHGQWTLNIQKTGDVFAITWRKGETVHFTGLGLEIDDGIAVGWYPDISQLAFLDYTVDPTGLDRLMATWGLGGITSLGTQVLVRK
jgi:hypothetical protein